MTKPRVAIIILNWNGKRDTEECLESLGHISYENYFLVIVDNASTDGSVEYFKEKFPTAALVKNNENLGYAEGNNVGVGYALENDGPEYVLVLNNDTVVAPDFLDKMIDVAIADDSVGVVGPKVYYYDRPGVINSAGARMRWSLGLAENIGIGKPDNGKYDKMADMDCLQGCALLIRADLIKKIGLFDRTFFIMLEETDFCLRAHEAGYRVVYCPGAVIHHKEGSSIKKVSLTGLYYKHRNRLLLVKKHYSRPQIAVAALPMAARFAEAVAYYVMKNNLPAASTVIKAYRDGSKIFLTRDDS
jgi:hypothetical protein